MRRAPGGARSLAAAAAAARHLAAALLALALSAAGCGGMERGDGAGDGPPEMEVLFRVDSLSSPESVAWDAVRQRWLVTNVADGEEGTGTGFITAVSADGDRVTLRAYGAGTPGLRLDGPRGIAVRGDRAFVADLRRVVALDLAGDSALWSREPEGSELLNDVAVAPSGGVYVSDTRAGAVWWMAADGSEVRRIGAAGSLRGPSGLLVEGAADAGSDGAAGSGGVAGGGRVLVAGWEGAVLSLAPDSSVTLMAGSPEFGHLEGLQSAPDGGLLVSDFDAGRIHHLRRKGEGVWQAGVAWLTGLRQPSDFLVRDSVLAVPELGAGRVTFYRIGGG